MQSFHGIGYNMTGEINWTSSAVSHIICFWTFLETSYNVRNELLSVWKKNEADLLTFPDFDLDDADLPWVLTEDEWTLGLSLILAVLQSGAYLLGNTGEVPSLDWSNLLFERWSPGFPLPLFLTAWQEDCFLRFDISGAQFFLMGWEPFDSSLSAKKQNGVMHSSAFFRVERELLQHGPWSNPTIQKFPSVMFSWGISLLLCLQVDHRHQAPPTTQMFCRFQPLSPAPFQLAEHVITLNKGKQIAET